MWIAAIFALSHVSQDALAQTSRDLTRSVPILVKIITNPEFVHTVEFGCLAFLIYRLWRIHDLTAIDSQNRPYNLQEEGRPLLELF